MRRALAERRVVDRAEHDALVRRVEILEAQVRELAPGHAGALVALLDALVTSTRGLPFTSASVWRYLKTVGDVSLQEALAETMVETPRALGWRLRALHRRPVSGFRVSRGPIEGRSGWHWEVRRVSGEETRWRAD
jgi:hypothetical protein